MEDLEDRIAKRTQAASAFGKVAYTYKNRPVLNTIPAGEGYNSAGSLNRILYGHMEGLRNDSSTYNNVSEAYDREITLLNSHLTSLQNSITEHIKLLNVREGDQSALEEHVLSALNMLEDLEKSYVVHYNPDITRLIKPFIEEGKSINVNRGLNNWVIKIELPKMIELSGVALGYFNLIIGVSTQIINVKVLGEYPNFDNSGVFWHPHISDSGSPCYGDSGNHAKRALHHTDIMTITSLIESVIECYNADNPFKSLSHWKQGTPCYFCERIDKEVTWDRTLRRASCPDCVQCKSCNTAFSKEFIPIHHINSDNATYCMLCWQKKHEIIVEKERVRLAELNRVHREILQQEQAAKRPALTEQERIYDEKIRRRDERIRKEATKLAETNAHQLISNNATSAGTQTVTSIDVPGILERVNINPPLEDYFRIEEDNNWSPGFADSYG